MAFMEPEIVHGTWYLVDGPCGTDAIPADVCGEVNIDGFESGAPVPAGLADYTENRKAYSIEKRDGWAPVCRPPAIWIAPNGRCSTLRKRRKSTWKKCTETTMKTRKIETGDCSRKRRLRHDARAAWYATCRAIRLARRLMGVG